MSRAWKKPTYSQPGWSWESSDFSSHPSRRLFKRLRKRHQLYKLFRSAKVKVDEHGTTATSGRAALARKTLNRATRLGPDPSGPLTCGHRGGYPLPDARSTTSRGTISPALSVTVGQPSHSPD